MREKIKKNIRFYFNFVFLEKDTNNKPEIKKSQPDQIKDDKNVRNRFFFKVNLFWFRLT